MSHFDLFVVWMFVVGRTSIAVRALMAWFGLDSVGSLISLLHHMKGRVQACSTAGFHPRRYEGAHCDTCHVEISMAVAWKVCNHR